MELQRLRDFIALAEELHYERAATRLGADQSGLSRRIRELERDVGVRLFARTTRGTTIAPAGVAFLPFAHCILGKIDQGVRAAREAAADANVTLRVGICDEVPVKKLARLISAFQGQEPRADVKLVYRACTELIQDLEIGVLDIALSLGAAKDRSALRAAEVWEDRSCVVMHTQHRLAQLPELDLESLIEERIIVAHRECRCGARVEVDSFLRSIAPGLRIEGAANLNALMALVSARRSIGLVSDAQAEAIRPPELVMRSLAGRHYRFRTFVLQRQEESSTQAEQFFGLARGV